MAAQVYLEKGVRYRGRIDVAAPSLFVTSGKVVDALTGVGFTDVLIWFDASDLPADWPSEARQDVTDSGHTMVWLEGAWSHDSGQYPSSGSRWTLVDYWPVMSMPVATDDYHWCGVEGYTCDPANSLCCPNLACKQDDSGAYGGGFRCQTAITKASAPPKSTALLWYVVMGGAAVLLAYWGWNVWQERRRNPVNIRFSYPSKPYGGYIQGEWWIHPGGSVEFCDGDIVGSNHVSIALRDLFADVDRDEAIAELKKLGKDTEKFEEDEDYDVPQIISSLWAMHDLEKLWKARPEWRDLWEEPIESYLKRGAIRVVDQVFQVWKLSNDKIKTIQDFIYEEKMGMGEDPEPSSDVMIEDASSGKTGEVKMSEFLTMTTSRQFWAQAGARWTEIEGEGS